MQRMQRLGQRVLIGFLGVVLGVGVLAPTAAQAAPFELSLSGAAAYAGKTTPIRILLTDAGQPVSGADVLIQRRSGEILDSGCRSRPPTRTVGPRCRQ